MNTTAQMNQPAARGHIEARDVAIRFKSNGKHVNAVDGVSIHVQPGEFVSLIGPSGCGKSSLLNVVAGFMQPLLVNSCWTASALSGLVQTAAWCFNNTRCFPG